MSLFWATFLTGVVLLGGGAVLLTKQRLVAPVLLAFPRSQRAAAITMGLASAWFLAHILQLSEADFGAYRGPLFVAFAAVAVLSFVHVREFLAVRGLAILVLLTAQVLLLSAKGGYELPTRLFLVSFVYVAILAALYLGASPFRLRDFLQWTFAKQSRTRGLGGFFAFYGLLLVVVALLYP